MAATVVGAFVVAGCVIALLFEAQGFGRPRDTAVRPGYVVLLGAGALAGIGLPAVLWARLLDGAARIAYPVAAVAAIALVLAVLGVLP